jgi:hypothetical protein
MDRVASRLERRFLPQRPADDYLYVTRGFLAIVHVFH